MIFVILNPLNYNSYKKIWQLSWPLIISGLGQTLINITDTLFLGRLNEVALGASAISGLFYSTLTMIAFGLGNGTQIIIARYSGANQTEKISDIFNQSNLLQTFLALTITIFLYLTYLPALELMVSNANIRVASADFLRFRILGLIPLFILTSFRSLYAGIGKTKVIGFTTIILALINFLLNFVLVFGMGSLKPLGIKGSALASVIAELIACLFIIIYTIVFYQKNGWISFRFKINFSKQKEIISLSYPLIMQFLISLISWFLFFLIVERIGANDLAVSNVIRNVYMIIMSPILAYCQVTSTIVSHHTGMKDFGNLKNLLFKVIALSLGTTLVIVSISFLIPGFLLRIFTNQNLLIQKGIPTLQLVFVALILFSISVPILNALSATGKTKISFLIEFITMFLYVGLSYLFGLVLHFNLTVVWSVEIIYFLTIGFSAYYYLEKFVKNKLNEIT